MSEAVTVCDKCGNSITGRQWKHRVFPASQEPAGTYCTKCCPLCKRTGAMVLEDVQ